MMLIAPLQLDMSFGVSFGNKWSSRLHGATRACISQESSHVATGKRQEQTGEGIEHNIRYAFTGTDSKNSRHNKLPPLVNALKVSAEQNAASFHFPGHNRGQAAPLSLTQLISSGPFLHDLPELPELDNLFSPEGPILEAQKQAAELFGASETWFLVGGSTCGVQAAIMATCSPGDTIILPRNSHLSAISAMVFSGAKPKYILPKYDSNWDIAGGVTPLQVENAIHELEMESKKPAAVLVISPTYHGICSDIRAIARVCHSHKIPVIVDEAHGAHLGFHQELPSSSLAQGADLVVQSTHKVLCSLTQSSMLHMFGNLIDRERICRCLQTLQSSSPSYLLLASLDAARAQIGDNREIIFNRAIDLAFEARNMIHKIPGITLLDHGNFPDFPSMDPLRITVGVQQLGLSGYEADDILCRNFGVVSELVGTKSITFAFNFGTKKEHVLRLVSGLKYLSATSSPTRGAETRVNDIMLPPPFGEISSSLDPREAFFASKRKVDIQDSLGEICGELICPYPPGIPVLLPGELITQNALNYLLYVRDNGAVITGAADHLLSSLLVCNA